MRPVRSIIIFSIASSILVLGVVAYLLFAGPDAIHLTGRSLPDLWNSGDLMVPLIILVTVLISAAIMLPFLRILFPREIKNGVTAQARVLKVWDTGVSINTNLQVGLLLEVSPPGGTPFQAEGKTLVSRLNVALVQPGATAEVKYDPEKPQRLQVLSLNLQPAASTNTATRLEELDALRDKDLITEEEYRQKREEILKSL